MKKSRRVKEGVKQSQQWLCLGCLWESVGGVERDCRDATTLGGTASEGERWRKVFFFKGLLYVRDECPFDIFQAASQKF